MCSWRAESSRESVGVMGTPVASGLAHWWARALASGPVTPSLAAVSLNSSSTICTRFSMATVAMEGHVSESELQWLKS